MSEQPAKPLTIVIDVQHCGKPDNPGDRGAVFEFGGSRYYEAYLVMEYARVAWQALSYAGHHVHLQTYGTYRNRAAFANKIKADLYLACHLNSSQTPPDKNRASVYISELAGDLTKAFANHLSRYFGHELPVDLSDVRIMQRGRNGWGCICYVAPPALLLEPLFGNHPGSWPLLRDDPWLIGNAIVNAVQAFTWPGEVNK